MANKNPIELANSLMKSDGLDEYIDDLYENGTFSYDTEWGDDNGNFVYHRASPTGEKGRFNVVIEKNGDVLDEFDDWIPIKKAREQSKQQLIDRIRKVIGDH